MHIYIIKYTKIQNCHQVNKKKGSHDLKWSSPFDYQQKSRASVTCSPRAKQKQKKKAKKHSKPNCPPRKTPFPRKSPTDP